MASAKVTFLGAAQNVTGSCYLLQAGGKRLMVDCGLYQERELRQRNWEPFLEPPSSVDAVLLTHAHLDHCGLLPRLWQQGFRGPVYCTPATADVARLVLRDSARLQEEDAEFKRTRHEREGRSGPYPVRPLYSVEDAEAVLALFREVPYGRPLPLGGELEAEWRDAGHILGSASIRFGIGTGPGRRVLLFSGDVGRPGRPILQDPAPPGEADWVVVESTYGDRLHDAAEDASKLLAEAVVGARRAGGNVVIPSFAVERAHEVLYELNRLVRSGKLEPVPVYFDSPMAVGVTGVFRHHPELFDEEMKRLVESGDSPFDFPGLRMVQSGGESAAIDKSGSPAVIIAGSGMCTGGRIKHHLMRNISRPGSIILFVGYQAAGTLGREITEGAKEVRINGEVFKVRARVVQLHSFSAHADRDELLGWLSGLPKKPARIFVTHGEPEAARSFAGFLGEKRGWETCVPAWRDCLEL